MPDIDHNKFDAKNPLETKVSGILNCCIGRLARMSVLDT